MELKIENISKVFKDKVAVENFTVTLNEGIYGLLGPNGSGKSTLMRIIVDVVNESNGKIMLNGKNKKSLGDQYRDLIGYLPQDIGFYSSFTAEKFLYYVAALKGIEKRDAKEKIDNLLEFVNLESDRKRKIKKFSGGMKQRLGIAQALLNDPKILVLDEPTAGLDPKERIRFKNLISNLSRNRIVILSTHIVSDLESLATEILIMKEGKLLEKDNQKNILKKLQGKIWSLTIEINELEEMIKKYKVINTYIEKDKITLKIIDDKRPTLDAVIEQPNLDDLFFYYFEEGENNYVGIS